MPYNIILENKMQDFLNIIYNSNIPVNISKAQNYITLFFKNIKNSSLKEYYQVYLSFSTLLEDLNNFKQKNKDLYFIIKKIIPIGQQILNTFYQSFHDDQRLIENTKYHKNL